MADDFRIDSHKLIYHPEKVADWLRTGDTYPITVEISPSGSCNHRCVFCAFDYLEYKPVFLDRDLISQNLQEMSENGVISIVVCGEGEPLLNKNTPEIITQIKSSGMDVSLVSNGALFNNEVAQECLPSLSWVRFSVNAGSDETHQRVHKSKPGEFEKIIANISNAVYIKRQNNLNATIGVQMLLINENLAEVFEFARRLAEIGVDYFTVKPYSQHPKSLNSLDGTIEYDNCLELESSLESLNVNSSFRVIFRSNSMKKLKRKRSYNRCWGHPFWAYIDAKANIWDCIAHIGDYKFCYGNLKENSFKEIWEGNRRKEISARVAQMGIAGCRELCRLDEINSYLHQLKHPHPHVNFI